VESRYLVALALLLLFLESLLLKTLSQEGQELRVGLLLLSCTYRRLLLKRMVWILLLIIERLMFSLLYYIISHENIRRRAARSLLEEPNRSFPLHNGVPTLQNLQVVINFIEAVLGFLNDLGYFLLLLVEETSLRAAASDAPRREVVEELVGEGPPEAFVVLSVELDAVLI